VLLEAADLRFGYDRSLVAPVLDGVSLRVATGGLVGILGPNGSGKTTLLRLLAGTLTPAAGRVRLAGEELARIPRQQLARRIAVVPQETQLAFDYTVLEIVLMGRYPHLGAFEIEGPADIASSMAALESTGTSHLASRPFHTLSGGEKQRVVIASALAQLDEGIPTKTPDTMEPRVFRPGAKPGPEGPGLHGVGDKLLFLDEPTASLDLRYQIEVGALLRRLHDRRDITIVLSTHDLQFAASVCHEVLLLRSGRVLAHGETRRVLTPETLASLYEINVNQVPALPAMAPR
jgi:iron complex transport system ATP-binding protein